MEGSTRTRPACPKYHSCSSMFCPQDLLSSGKAVWYADEPICALRLPAGGPRWLRVQKRIRVLVQKGAITEPERTCYTLEMLAALNRVGPGLAGINPDAADRPGRVRKWLAQRRPPRAPSAAPRRPPQMTVRTARGRFSAVAPGGQPGGHGLRVTPGGGGVPARGTEACATIDDCGALAVVAGEEARLTCKGRFTNGRR